jgi:hypothetical protein
MPSVLMRHTFAALSIAAIIATFLIARQMGMSVEQIEKTYEHLPDAAESHAGSWTHLQIGSSFLPRHRGWGLFALVSCSACSGRGGGIRSWR